MIPADLNKPKRNKYVRFTSNVLRSGGIINDVLCFLLSFGLARLYYSWYWGYYLDVHLHVTAAIVMAINFFLIRISRDAYSALRGEGDDMGRGTLVDFLVAITLTAFTITQFGMIREFSIRFGLIFIGCSFIMLLLSRMMLRRLMWRMMRAGHIGQRVAIYGADREITGRVLELLEIERLPHINVIGFADDRKSRVDTAALDNVPYLGGFDSLLALAREGRLDQLIVALPHVRDDRLKEIVAQLSAGAIDVCIMPREFLILRDRYRVNYIGSLPVLNVWQQPMRDFDGVLKEFQDRVLALIALILLSPLLIATAIAIKIDSPGPLLFRQKRFGFNNLEIDVLKFRSMYVNKQDVSGAQRTRKGDPRVTRVGRFIRRFSIDELPQLINVLRGEMSIVGPRPHATEMRVGDSFYYDAVHGYAARHRVKPGITGLAQVRGLRGEIDTMDRAKKRVEYDIYYIENWSPLFDMRIILETCIKLVWDRHAY